MCLYRNFHSALKVCKGGEVIARLRHRVSRQYPLKPNLTQFHSILPQTRVHSDTILILSHRKCAINLNHIFIKNYEQYWFQKYELGNENRSTRRNHTIVDRKQFKSMQLHQFAKRKKDFCIKIKLIYLINYSKRKKVSRMLVNFYYTLWRVWL